MKIMYVLPETIYTAGGGIATYHGHARRALEASGHETCLVTWTIGDSASQEITDLDKNSVCLNISRNRLHKEFGKHPENIAVGLWLSSFIIKFIEHWSPDVIETSDYLAPLYGYLAKRRAGLLTKSQTRPVIAYNHGLVREIARADAHTPSVWERQQFAAERTALRWADRVLVPSNAAMDKLRRMMVGLGPSVICPEPFWAEAPRAPAAAPADRFVHMGRVDFAKGIDTDAHLLNILHATTTIEEIVMIGRAAGTPFRTRNAEEYFLARLPKDLRSRVRFPGRISPQERAATLNPDGRAGYSLNLSGMETFNYTFLEMLEQGLAPLTLAGTPMAEFVPGHLAHTLIPQEMAIDPVRQAFDAIRSRPAEYVEEVRRHAFEVASPNAFAERYERIAAALLAEPVLPVGVPGRRRFTQEDVTVLIAAHNPGEFIREAVDSILAQTRAPKLIIYDDGTSNADSAARLAAASTAASGIRLIRSAANEGLCATRRKLIRECDTELAIFMDDDDLLDPHYVEKTLAAMNDNTVDADAVITFRQNFDESSERVLNYNLEDHELLLSNDYRMTSLIRTSVLRELDFSATLRNGEADDWDFWNRFKMRGHRFVLYPEALFKYRFRSGSMSWPWSEGQNALTAELVARAAWEGIRNGTVPEDFLLDLYCDMLGRDHATERVFMNHVRKSHGIVGTILHFLHKQSYSLAKRL